MGHDDYKEMIPVHALSALDASDERALNEHLAECAECRRDLAEWERTAASLALSADPMEPSPAIRDQILRRALSEKSPSKVLRFQSPQRNLWPRLGSLASVAAVLAFAVLLVSVIVLWQQNRRLRQENEDVHALLSSPAVRVKKLTGTAEAPNARATFVFGENGRALLVVSGLPRPPQGKEYQLWTIEPKTPPKPGKTFSTDSAGTGLVEERVFEVAREYGEFAVTLEPAGGVQAPTGAIYLRSAL